MHTSLIPPMKRTLTIALTLGAMLALFSADVEARRGGGGGGRSFSAPRASVGGGGRSVKAPRASFGGGGQQVRAPRANIGSGGRNLNVNRGQTNVGRRDIDVGRRDVSVSRRDIDINRDVDIDVDRNWGYWGRPVATTATVMGTALAVGAIVSSLPPSCRTVVVNGVTYQDCGGTFYVPRYDGPTVVYEVVSPPSGWNG